LKTLGGNNNQDDDDDDDAVEPIERAILLSRNRSDPTFVLFLCISVLSFFLLGRSNDEEKADTEDTIFVLDNSLDADGIHPNRGDRVVVAGRDFGDLLDQLVVVDDPPEHGVGRFRRLVEEIQEAVVCCEGKERRTRSINIRYFDSFFLVRCSHRHLPVTLMKNWLPPDSGEPVLAMDRVPARLLIFSVSSSGMPPSRLRL